MLVDNYHVMSHSMYSHEYVHVYACLQDLSSEKWCTVFLCPDPGNYSYNQPALKVIKQTTL